MVIQDEAPPDGYVGLAKSWYEKNSRWGKKIKSELGQSNFTIDWTKYKITSNVNGDSVITVPIKSKKDTFYREIGLMMGKDNIPYGIIKEYLGNPFKESTILNIYTGTGRLLETAWYDHEKKTMKYIEIKREKKGLLNWVKKKFACTGCGGNMNDGFTMEEVEIDGYRPKEPDDLYGGNPIDIPGYPGNEGDPNEGVQSGGGGGSSNSGGNNGSSNSGDGENTALDLSYQTFKFVEITKGWQEAGVKNLRIRVKDFQRGIFRTINLPTYVVGVRGTMTKSQAAEFAAGAINYATDLVWGLYRSNSQLPSDPEIINAFEGFVRSRLSLEGGRLQKVNMTTDKRVIISEADYDLF